MKDFFLLLLWHVLFLLTIVISTYSVGLATVLFIVSTVLVAICRNPIDSHSLYEYGYDPNEETGERE